MTGESPEGHANFWRMNMDDLFTAEDLVLQTESGAYPLEASDALLRVINAKFRKWLEAQQKVYGNPWGNERMPGDTHEAYIVDIKLIEKEG